MSTDHSKVFSRGRSHQVTTEIESEAGHSINLGAVLMSKVTAGHEIESDAGMCKNGNPTSFSISWPAMTELNRNESWSITVRQISLSISWPASSPISPRMVHCNNKVNSSHLQQYCNRYSSSYLTPHHWFNSWQTVKTVPQGTDITGTPLRTCVPCQLL